MIGELPKTATIGGVEYEIRTDFRDILKILLAFEDPDLEDFEKLYVCIYIMFPDADDFRKEDLDEAYKFALWFIDCGEKDSDKKPSRKVMDWEQDEQIIFAAVNKVAGMETRAAEYIHWWTFMGYYMEISDGVFSQVVSLRSKKSKGKKLEKWEQEYWSNNKSLCELKPKESEKEKAEKERLNRLLGGHF